MNMINQILSNPLVLILFNLVVLKFYFSIRAKLEAKEDKAREIRRVKSGETLIEAVKMRNLEGVKEALAQGADIHAQNGMALIDASINNQLDMVKYLVEHGAGIHAQQRALLSAICRGHLPIVEYLIDSGIDLRPSFMIKDEIVYGCYQDHEIIVSAFWGHSHISQYLASKGYDVKNILLYGESHDSSSLYAGVACRGLSVFNRISKEKMESAMAWARRYINAKELSEKLENDLQPKTTTRTGRIKI